MVDIWKTIEARRERKILVGFFGVLRSLPLVLPSIEKNVYAAIRAENLKMKTVGHFNCPEFYDSPRSSEHGIPAVSHSVTPLNLELCWLEPQTDSSIKAFLPIVKGLPWSAGEADADGKIARNALFGLYSLTKLWELMQLVRIDDYDWILLLRADLLYEDPLPVNEIADQIRKGADLITPSWQSWGGLNDRFAACSKRGAEVYLNRLFAISEFCSVKKLFQAEQFLKYVATSAELQRGTMRNRASRVRANGVVWKEDFSDL